MARLSPTLRALVLVPLLAVAVDVARATVACGPQAQSCLEAAGRGWLGAAGPVLLVLYAVALALAVGAARPRARGGRRARLPALVGRRHAPAWPPSAAARRCSPGAIGDPAALGGGWAELLAFCAAAGALLALALRVAPAAEALVRSLRPSAPRIAAAIAPVRRIGAAAPWHPPVRFALATRERGPPAPLD